jgi:hypothetical protein
LPSGFIVGEFFAQVAGAWTHVMHVEIVPWHVLCFAGFAARSGDAGNDLERLPRALIMGTSPPRGTTLTNSNGLGRPAAGTGGGSGAS